MLLGIPIHLQLLPEIEQELPRIIYLLPEILLYVARERSRLLKPCGCLLELPEGCP